jgi:hypothetical protein
MLEPLPPSFRATVASLHLVASELVAPARKPDNEIALIATPGGFGTPRFEFDGCERQVRVEGAELVQDCGEKGERRAPLTSLATGAEAINELLPLDAEAILARLCDTAEPGDDPSPAYLWPEHFDIAIELGSEARGTRANFGFSPGDEQHEEPYLYVGPWSAPIEGDHWNGRGFSGAELTYSQLLDAGDQGAAAIEFFVGRREALAALATD